MHITNKDLKIITIEHLMKHIDKLPQLTGDNQDETFFEITSLLEGKKSDTNNNAAWFIYYSFNKMYHAISNGYYDDKTFSEFKNDLKDADKKLNITICTLLYEMSFLDTNDYNDALKHLGGQDNLINAVMNDNTGCIDIEMLKIKIINMQYKDFLNTVYWKAIRQYKLNKANHKCTICNSTKKLNVHHKTYDRHGLEHIPQVADEDLIVLCGDCHAKFHDKLVN